ncbi:hypothetical protein DICPUDRAFT_91310 [Dictyostelium purpureum]|uniref:LIM zinc-binding domain-containing protein n=1 Tax=Dictyostelium purpureum TaxID=5786 RepID=F0ZAE5_DICPU|nr:uncharacterized protein DICPUDRAFT_91310 [Dictyostelium purpureum]EGC39058.1 hypothetical protein DICPUDRAFT_91310 [Dictyostelium purpureum]|eukprot:XP_003284408.1 hypothetical protein DICPUDRAFT_91310 [Dictyostelium purpureum]
MATKGLNMDDLDLLLADLGRPKSTTKSITPTNSGPSSISNKNSYEANDIQNEIQSIIEELDAQPQTAQTISTPAPKLATPVNNTTTTASFSVSTSHQPQPQPQIDGIDDLDELMESLNTSISTALKAVPSTPEEHIASSNSSPTLTRQTASPVNNNNSGQKVTSTATVIVKKPLVQSKASLENTNTQNSSPPPQHRPFAATATATATPSSEDLDELLKGLSPSNNNTVKTVVPQPVPQNNYNNNRPSTSTTTVTTQINIGRQQQPSNNNNNGQQPSNGPKVLHGDDLDNLLTNLTSQVKDIDSSGPTARGTCGGCRKPIFGETIQAMGKFYHPEHFCCHNCQNPLGTRNYYEQESMPHCEKCYQELFCARCAHCDEPISDRCITALGKKWHVHHFVCTQCLKPFDGGNFFERDGRPYCEADFYSTFAVRCGGCNQPIRGECINALGTQWHPEHFVCQYCQKSFTNGQFFEYGGKPYCDIHYHQQAGSVCSGCGKAVSGRCVDALDKKWHPEHFVCAFCMNPLAGGSYTANNGKPYCKGCSNKLFG